MVRTGVINEFRGEHFFLSNYFTSRFEWRKQIYLTGEQAFAHAKTWFVADFNTAAEFRKRILKSQTPGEAKQAGREAPINVPAWDAAKVQLMRELTHAKFRTSEDSLVGPLINTGATMLVEGNDWNDKFWGRCLDKTTGKWVGLNTLGVILMEERGWWSRGDEGKPS